MEFSPSELKILEAALSVVNQYTISGTRMHLIAEEAGMSPANLHYHFKTKKDLLLSLMRYIQNNFSLRRDDDFKKQPDHLEGQLRGFFNQKKNLILYEPKLDRTQFDFWTQGQIDPEINTCFLETFQVWREHIIRVIQKYRPGAAREKLELVAEVMVSMMMGATMQYLSSGAAGHLDQYFAMCERSVLDMLDAE